MLDRLFYEDKGVFLQNHHTIAILTYLAVLFTLSLLFSHPLYLVGILVVGFLAIIAAEALDSWESYLKIGLWMAILIMIVNPLVFHAGKTVLWHGPVIPVLGNVTICLEAICYGAAMGVRLLAVLTVFCLFNAVVHPDKTLSLFSRFAYKSALIASLATRALPAAGRDLANIREVQQMRGVNYGSGGPRERLRKHTWLLEVLLTSSLEGALQTAEAMQARAFGAGPRSRYRREPARPRDFLCFTAGLLALVFSLSAKAKGYGDYVYYPQLGSLVADAATVFWLGVILFCLSLPVILSWGWRHCPCLKSKI